MHDEGADFHFEQTEVVGELISRCRGRYKWDDGVSMEYELTDIGGSAKPDLLQSLGFNFDQENTEDATGYPDPFTYTISSVLMRLDGLFSISGLRSLE